MGVNTIGLFMKKISNRLELSKSYTNHSIRATVVTTLADNGIEARQIMNVTGHKCESSLRSSNNDNSVAQKRNISSILAADNSSSSENKNQATSNSSEEENLQHHQKDKIMKIIDINSTATSNIRKNVSTTNGAPYYFISNNSNCTFNFK